MFIIALVSGGYAMNFHKSVYLTESHAEAARKVLLRNGKITEEWKVYKAHLTETNVQQVMAIK